MKRIWEAFVMMIVRWMTPKLEPEEEELTDSVCQCGHMRCTHKDGKYKCYGQFPPEGEQGWKKNWTGCACVVFIERGGRDDGDDPEPNPDPSEKEVLDMLGKLETK